MDLTVGEWLIATDKLVEILPEMYQPDKSYKILRIKEDKIFVDSELQEGLFYRSTFKSYFIKTQENELWI